MRVYHGVFLAGLLGAVACSSDSEAPLPSARTDEGVSVRQQALLHGENSGPEDNFAVRIRDLKRNNAASGTLVAPNLAITALHVVSSGVLNSDNVVDCKPGSAGLIINGLYPAEEIEVIPGEKLTLDKYPAPVRSKKISTLSKPDACEGDIAFILLEEPLKEFPIAPVRLEPVTQVGELTTAIGWGALDQYGTYPKVRQRQSSVVRALGPGQYQSEKGLVTLDLYPPHLVTSGSNPCSGDSGGGLFSQETGALVGTFSAITNEDPSKMPNSIERTLFCEGDTIAIYMRLDPFKERILEIFREAGHAPWREGKPKPAAYGETCTEDLDCDSMVCIGAQCSRECPDNTCDDGKECIQQGNKQVCAPPGYQNAAGAGGTPDVGRGVQGAPCTQYSDCASSLCVALGSSKVCSASCDSVPCTDGWTCTPAQQGKICLPPSNAPDVDESCSASGRRARVGAGLVVLLGLGCLCARRARRS